ncbi:hypothetical protein [Stakelama tenebrarum]|uniref:Uncharacterized protein n=1 Tax=Stakelama tenebrarum TaxID=2711215 RepID=A0A6G6Y200_9SPHN|nr:hypothetical protein [Sphingosinithalassobacter tenebrarum]QIG78837.1 hypothetical protein G5C33_02875 [Sphingosinithalassobacter tenebrarum]
MERTERHQKRAQEDAQHISARDARGGSINLIRRDERLLFGTGLAAMMILAAMSVFVGTL